MDMSTNPPGDATLEPGSGELFAVLQRVPGVAVVDDVKLYPADPITGKRADAVDRISLDPEALVFSYDHRVTVVAG